MLNKQLVNRASIDYELGWRWLIHLSESDTVYIAGFSNQQAGFLEEVLGTNQISSHAHEASVWLLSNISYAIGKKKLSGSKPKAVYVFGSNETINTWKNFCASELPNMAEYALLPKRAPRIVIPVDSVACMRSALSLYQPGRRTARIAGNLVKLFAGLGVAKLLDCSKLLICQKTTDEHFCTQGETAYRVSRYGLYLGNPEPNRKTVVLPMDEQGKSQYLIKCAESPEAMNSLQNESSTLSMLSKTNLQDRIPKVIGYTNNEIFAELRVEYRKRETASKEKLFNEAMLFISNLSQIASVRCQLHKIFDDADNFRGLQKTVKDNPLIQSVLKRFKELADQDYMVAGHLYHGDFTPWNTSWTHNGFFVFDWEMSTEWAPAFTDIFYYIISPAVLVPGSKSLEEIEKQLEKAASFFAHSSGYNENTIWMNFVISLASNSNKWASIPFFDALFERISRKWN